MDYSLHSRRIERCNYLSGTFARGPVRARQVWSSSHSNLAGRAASLSLSCYRAHIKCLTE